MKRQRSVRRQPRTFGDILQLLAIYNPPFVRSMEFLAACELRRCLRRLRVKRKQRPSHLRLERRRRTRD